MAAERLPVTGLGSVMRPTLFEPKRQNQFVFEMQGIDSYLIKTASVLPKLNIGEKEIDWINMKRYLASSKPTYDPISMVLYDPLTPSGAQLVMEWVRLHWEPLTGRMGYSDFYKRNAALKLLDPVGQVISRIEYTGCFITEANFGETQLDYSADEFLTISLTMRYDTMAIIF
jgi:hypothetical protein